MNHINDMGRRKRSYEAHTLDPSSHAYHTGMVANPASFHWHEMDYTSSTVENTQFAPTSAPVQYNTPGMTSFSPIDYTRHDLSYNSPYSEHDASASAQTSGLYRVGPFRYADLANMDADTASLSQESIYSRSTRLHSLTDSERRDSQPNSLLSCNDIRRESEGFDRHYSIHSMDAESCQSDKHGPEPPCLDLANLAPIEECAPGPCMTTSPLFLVSRPLSNVNTSHEQDSPVRTTHSGFSSPATLTFQEPTTTADASKVLKPKRIPRSKSASATIGEGAAAEKASKLRARQAHSLVERKYRDNLNLKISQLHQTLQNARHGPSSALRSPSEEIKSDYFDNESFMSPDIPNEKSSTGSTPTGPKVRKSDVLTDAMNYVNSAEMEMKRMSEEIMKLNAKVRALDKLIRCEDCSLMKQMVTLQMEGQQLGH